MDKLQQRLHSHLKIHPLLLPSCGAEPSWCVSRTWEKKTSDFYRVPWQKSFGRLPLQWAFLPSNPNHEEMDSKRDFLRDSCNRSTDGATLCSWISRESHFGFELPEVQVLHDEPSSKLFGFVNVYIIWTKNLATVFSNPSQATTHMLHVWHIYLHLPYFTIKNNQMSVNIPYMDGMGYSRLVHGVPWSDGLTSQFGKYFANLKLKKLVIGL